MKILMIGDVVARPGRVAVMERIQDLREQHAIDLAVMNAENVAGGFSITPQIADELFAAGIDVMTSGNHIFDKREVIPYIERQGRLLRPANYPDGTPGRGLWVGEVHATRVAVLCLMGRVFMPPTHGDPFRAADALLSSLDESVRVRLVDMHAEATSEKSAMGWYLDGRVSAVVGTHTHVQTADERILPGGTAYITDLGMTGPVDSVIGVDKDLILRRFLTQMPIRFEPAKGPAAVCGVVITVDPESGRASEIHRLRVLA
jgi:2',3'-cyclic-nucleotide 2'-phosphodiesterase